jgi:hypothetical protein
MTNIDTQETDYSVYCQSRKDNGYLTNVIWSSYVFYIHKEILQKQSKIR